MSLATDNDKSRPLWLVRLLAPLLTFALWLLSVVLGVIDIFAVWSGVAFLTGSRPLIGWRDPFIFLLAVVLAVFAFNSAQYHFTYFNQPRSWRLFAITLAAELGLLAVVVAAYFISAT